MEFRKMVTITLYTRQQKRHWCIEQSFGLCGRGRGWDDLGEWHWSIYNIIYETSRQSRFDARYWMLGAGALGRPWGMVWGGRWEEGSGWGTHVYLWWIHFDIWQNQYNIVKLKNKIKLKKKEIKGNRSDFYSWAAFAENLFGFLIHIHKSQNCVQGYFQIYSWWWSLPHAKQSKCFSWLLSHLMHPCSAFTFSVPCIFHQPLQIMIHLLFGIRPVVLSPGFSKDLFIFLFYFFLFFYFIF